MINDDFNFEFDCSDFPVSIEKFAAYLDGNLSDDEMQRVEAVIDGDEGMLGIVSQNIFIEDLQDIYDIDNNILPFGLKAMDFNIPEIASFDHNPTINYEFGIGNDNLSLIHISEPTRPY